MLKKKDCQPWILDIDPVQLSFRNEGEIKASSDEGNVVNLSPTICHKRMANGSSPNRKEMIKEGTLENQEGRTQQSDYV